MSNLVPASKATFDPLKHLCRDDIKFEGKLVLVYYKWSKTNQNSNKVSWIPLCSSSDRRFDIQCYFKKLFNIVKVPNSSPVFTYQKNEFLTKCSLSRLLDQCTSKAGLPVSEYSWHSFRRGAAVFAFELGLDESAVQLLGDWSSSAFKNYLEFAFVRKVAIAKKVSKSFDKMVTRL